MATDHAKLSPSGASRWLQCTPSAALEAKMPYSTSTFAEEGSFAHGFGELLIRNSLGRVSDAALKDAMVNIKKNAHYCEAMHEYMEQYRAFVLEQFSEAQMRTSDAVIDVEVKVDITEYVPEGFGTVDILIVSDQIMHIIDLKYGAGVPVSCKENKQMMLYALGALRDMDMLYDIKDVQMTIYQPRLDNISSWTLGAAELRNWGEGYLKPRAEMAFKGEGEFVAGDHCRFCKIKNRCRALADQNLEIAKYKFREAPLLADSEIADILVRTSLFVNWINGVNDYALAEALNGKKFEGFKLVEGRSVRSYSNADAVADKLTSNGIPEALIYEKKLLGITAMEKAITKKTFTTLLDDLITKPPGKPTLVEVSDKRAEINSLDKAIAAFEDSELE